jgi:hypothetical protein
MAPYRWAALNGRRPRLAQTGAFPASELIRVARDGALGGPLLGQCAARRPTASFRVAALSGLPDGFGKRLQTTTSGACGRSRGALLLGDERLELDAARRAGHSGPASARSFGFDLYGTCGTLRTGGGRYGATGFGRDDDFGASPPNGRVARGPVHTAPRTTSGGVFTLDLSLAGAAVRRAGHTRGALRSPGVRAAGPVAPQDGSSAERVRSDPSSPVDGSGDAAMSARRSWAGFAVADGSGVPPDTLQTKTSARPSSTTHARPDLSASYSPAGGQLADWREGVRRQRLMEVASASTRAGGHLGAVRLEVVRPDAGLLRARLPVRLSGSWSNGPNRRAAGPRSSTPPS